MDLIRERERERELKRGGNEKLFQFQYSIFNIYKMYNKIKSEPNDNVTELRPCITVFNLKMCK